VIKAKPCAGYLCYLFNLHQFLPRRIAAHPASPLMIEVVQWRGQWRASVERGGEIACEHHHVPCIAQALSFMSLHFTLTTTI